MSSIDLRPLLQAYDSMPGLHCHGCPGDCCVSPTLTAAELVHFLRSGQQAHTPQDWLKLLTQAPREHQHWPGTAYCAFQDPNSGLCLNYSGRAMACRLHGHEVLRLYESPDMVFCDRDPDKDRLLNAQGLETLLDITRSYVGQVGAPYEAPFYFVSLNLDCWLDFLYDPKISQGRPQLEATWEQLHQWLDLPPLAWRSRTTLAGKLDAIERAFADFLDGHYLTARNRFAATRSDFPSVGSYFLDEAKIWEAECEKALQG